MPPTICKTTTNAKAAGAAMIRGNSSVPEDLDSVSSVNPITPNSIASHSEWNDGIGKSWKGLINGMLTINPKNVRAMMA